MKSVEAATRKVITVRDVETRQVARSREETDVEFGESRLHPHRFGAARFDRLLGDDARAHDVA